MCLHVSHSCRLCLAAFLVLALSFAPRGATLEVPSKEHPDIGRALSKAKKGDTVLVAKGVYRESFSVGSGITLLSKERFGARIDGGGAEKVITLVNNAALVGFDVSSGTIGVYSGGHGNRIIQCLVHGNTQTGIMCVGHLPTIEDNVVVYNEGSGIQGWDVRSTVSAVAHNTIAYNGNHGISLGGNSQLFLENNILAFNEKMGMKVEPQVKVTLRRNCFFGNTEIFESFPSDNFAFDPLFVAPRKMNFKLAKGSRCHNMGTDNQDLGARLGD
ncbi:MAG: hypothetical protein GF418_05375 [Chitinivibrionales bacterium]|nr:hypothetical protein [Chitinivibrionales bacterium]MBD3395042.1 hypothetical protein [Chitinivibrionales bacterium]